MRPTVVVLAPSGRDSLVAATIIETLNADVYVASSLEEAIEKLASAWCLVVTTEALLNSNRRGLQEWLGTQEPWSDLPIVLLTARDIPVDARLSFLDDHVIALERPFQAATLAKSVRTALRARQRQLEVKAFIDEKVELAQRQQLLIRELHHRVKNTLANVQAMMRATARGSEDIEEFLRDFSSRIVSLADTHTLLTNDYWQTAPLREMLEKELRIYEVAESNRISLSGPDVQLVADIAIPFGMAIHELASNSSRHGSLSNEAGRLLVAWELEPGDNTSILRLVWREQDGPPVTPPKRRGFGTTLLEKVLTLQCSAEVTLSYDPSGFSGLIGIPLRADRLVPTY